MIIGDVEVVWDGIQVYRVPTPKEIDALVAISSGLSANRVGPKMRPPISTDQVQRRVSGAMSKTGARSASQALYRLYRLQVVDSPVDPRLTPLLTRHQQNVLGLATRDGLTDHQVAEKLGISHKTVDTHLSRCYATLRARHRVQAMRLAVARGDLTVDRPPQLWRGVV